MKAQGRFAVASVLGLAALGFSALSRGDELYGTRFDMSESAHEVRVRLDRGHATLVVVRTVAHNGARSDQAVFFLNVPQTAVATRLRTAALGVSGAPVWFEGELMEAEEAARKYRELTGLGGFYPKDPALLSWRHQGLLALQVFPVPARASKTLEYTLEMPMRYEQGRYRLELEPMGTAARAATAHFAPAHPQDAIAVNGVPVGSLAPVPADRALEVTLAPRAVPRLDGAFSQVPYAKDRFLVHARIDASPRLGDVPGHAAIVVVLDVSRSAAEQIGEARAAARAYLSHFPSAEVQVLTFDRAVRSAFGPPRGVRETLAGLSGLEPKPANGSRLDDALAQADAALSRSRAGARRILVLTDLRTRSSLAPDRVAARTLQSGALVHLATISAGAPGVRRDDDDAWAAVARKTGGLLFRAECGQSVDSTTRAVFEEWARPKRLERLSVKGLPAAFAAPDELPEGQGLEHFDLADRASPQLEVAGELWSRPVRALLVPSAEEGRRWAALVFGSPLMDQLDDKQQMVLARLGRAVSPVTSYLAIEPGVRPSIEGLEPTEVGLSGIGSGGGGRGVGIGLGSVGTLGRPVDRQKLLDSAVRAAWDRCKGGTAQVALELETTLDEIVDISRIEIAPVSSARLEPCLREEMWQVDLPHSFRQLERASWTARAQVP
jgi:hypothetical protein